MNVDYAKFEKKFDSRTISRELPFKARIWKRAHTAMSFTTTMHFKYAKMLAIVVYENTKHGDNTPE